MAGRGRPKGKPSDRWDEVLFDKNGKPKVKMGPEGWFAYCVKKSGGISQLAEKMGVSRQTVHASWGNKFPDKYIVLAEKKFGIPRELLAPHFFADWQRSK
jgi:hypothetical protein